MRCARKQQVAYTTTVARRRCLLPTDRREYGGRVRANDRRPRRRQLTRRAIRSKPDTKRDTVTDGNASLGTRRSSSTRSLFLSPSLCSRSSPFVSRTRSLSLLHARLLLREPFPSPAPSRVHARRRSGWGRRDSVISTRIRTRTYDRVLGLTIFRRPRCNGDKRHEIAISPALPGKPLHETRRESHTERTERRSLRAAPAARCTLASDTRRFAQRVAI